MRKRRYRYSYQEYIEKRNKILIILMCIVSILIVLFAIFHPHYYRVRQYKPATCTEDGYAHYECWCKESYTENYPATGHDYMIYTEDATCEEEGCISYICATCQYRYEEVIPKKEHSFTKEIQEPTCSREGTITYTCKNCGYTYSETLEMIDHEYVDGKCIYCGKTDETKVLSEKKTQTKKNDSQDNIEPQIIYPQLPAVVIIDGDNVIME